MSKELDNACSADSLKKIAETLDSGNLAASNKLWHECKSSIIEHNEAVHKADPATYKKIKDETIDGANKDLYTKMPAIHDIFKTEAEAAAEIKKLQTTKKCTLTESEFISNRSGGHFDAYEDINVGCKGEQRIPSVHKARPGANAAPPDINKN